MERRMEEVRICRDSLNGDIQRGDSADVSNESDGTAYVKEIKVTIIDEEMKARIDLVDKINTANEVGGTNNVKKRTRRIQSRKRLTRRNVRKPQTKRRTRKVKKLVESNRLIKHNNAHKLGKRLRRAENKIVRTRTGITCNARPYTDLSTTTVERDWKKRKR